MHLHVRFIRLSVAFIILLQYICSCTSAGFTEVPSNVTIQLGSVEQVVCRCSYLPPTVFFVWRVNGMPSGHFPDITTGSVNETGTIVNTLTIPASVEYNGTEVECVVVFLDGSPNELTPSATLTFHIVTSPTATLPTAVATLPPTNAYLFFEVSPSPLNVTVEQRVAVFNCQHRTSDNIIWRVNGISLLRSQTNISIEEDSLNGDGFRSSLSIETYLVFNETTVECVAIFFQESSPLLFSSPVILLIQDTPGEVKNPACKRNYSSNSLMTLWDSLPSLDLTDIDPDIVYTVELFKITCDKYVSMSHKVVAENSATEEGLDLMQIYKAVIAARNNVTGARNGPSVEMIETFMRLEEPLLFMLARTFQIKIPGYEPVPSYYTMSLESIDDLGLDLNTNITVERSGEIVSMSVEDVLPPKTLWKASIFPYGCQTDTIPIELSTHNIQNITVSSPLSGEVRVTGDFVEGSRSTNGIFLITYSPTNDSDVLYVAKQTERNDISMDITGLIGTEYGVSVFVLEDGLPFQRVAASPKSVAVATNSDPERTAQQLMTLEYQLDPTSTGICITCTFLDSSTTNCMAVVHQRISQLSSRGLMNIESSHKFNRSGDIAYGCIEGVNLEQYQVGVVNGKMFLPSMEPNDNGSPLVATVVSTVLCLLLTLIVVVLILIGIVVLRTRREIVTLYGEDGSSLHHLQSDAPTITLDIATRYPHRRVLPDSGSSHPTYAQPELPRSSSNLHPPTTEKLIYTDIQGFKNQQGQVYALPQLHVVSTLSVAPDDSHAVVYSEVQTKPKTQHEAPSTDLNPEPANNTDTPPHPESLNIDLLLSHLLPHASKWQSLGLALSLDDDQLDEIFTNNETDEDCLTVMLEVYMARSDIECTWEKIESALKKIAVGVQESDSTSNSPVIDRSTEFSIDLCAITQNRNLSYACIPDTCGLGRKLPTSGVSMKRSSTNKSHDVHSHNAEHESKQSDYQEHHDSLPSNLDSCSSPESQDESNDLTPDKALSVPGSTQLPPHASECEDAYSDSGVAEEGFQSEHDHPYAQESESAEGDSLGPLRIIQDSNSDALADNGNVDRIKEEGCVSLAVCYPSAGYCYVSNSHLQPFLINHRQEVGSLCEISPVQCQESNGDRKAEYNTVVMLQRMDPQSVVQGVGGESPVVESSLKSDMNCRGMLMLDAQILRQTLDCIK